MCCLIASGVQADDYFNRITMASNGRLTRFQRDVIMVYAEAVPLEAHFAKVYEHALIRSLNLWESATQGKLRFQFAPIAATADIRIRWTNQRRKWGQYENLGEAMLVRKSEGFYVEIEIALRNPATMKLLEPKLLQAALLHEIGHAIGLWGHSEDPNDVMYFAATAQKPTARDIATLLKVRETPVDTPFHSQAIAALKAAIQKEPEIVENYYSLGAVYADLGDYQSAINTFQEALAIDPLFQISAEQIARIFQQKGLYDLAIKLYRRSLGVNPSPQVLGALGTLSLLQGQFDRAAEFFQRALRLAPESTTLNQNLMATYHQWGFQNLKANRFSEAIGRLKQGLVRFPFSETLLYDLAVTYESAGDYQSALEAYERVLQISPQYPKAQAGIATTLNNLGAQRARDKDWNGAIALYQQALEHDRGCWHARQNLEEALLLIGWEKSQKGDFNGAIQTYQKLLEINPQNAQAYNNLGIIYFKKREYDRSTAHFEQALALNANYEEARANLNYVKRQRAFGVMKTALGPALLVLFASFIVVKIAVRAGGRSTPLTKL